MVLLGIDIGGSGIKGALVNSETGEFVSERVRIDTPAGALPADVADVVAQLVKELNYQGPVGCTMPAVVKNGVTQTAANIAKEWIGTDAAKLFSQKTGLNVFVMNDADAAGIAEITLGAGKGKLGTVIMITLGTGIGSAVFYNGVLLPNFELGHIEIDGRVAEKWASAAVRKERDLDWDEWGKRLNIYLNYVQKFTSPDLIIIGGGVSKKYEKFFPYLKVNTEIVPAQMFNDAGIVGAAIAAQQMLQQTTPDPTPTS
ncbi:MAG TPA: ROK family protein [Anaerolineales bacterium]|nr:ROK family protein [Anaerolineales bacterium]